MIILFKTCLWIFEVAPFWMNKHLYSLSWGGISIKSLDHNIYWEFTIYIIPIPQLPLLFEFYNWLLFSSFSYKSMHILRCNVSTFHNLKFKAFPQQILCLMRLSYFVVAFEKREFALPNSNMCLPHQHHKGSASVFDALGSAGTQPPTTSSFSSGMIPKSRPNHTFSAIRYYIK